MRQQDEERWRELCAEAAVEQDPDRLLKLIHEIDEMLDEKGKKQIQHQVKSQQTP